MSIHNNEAGATVKSERYDRQLRMWGQDGQQKLENAKILVLNATATSAEALKNLVLPGIGSFTLVDGKKVTLEDLGNQFFVSHEHVGQSRAAVVTQLLLELNPFVNGAHVEQEPSAWLAENSASLSNYTLVIAANVVEGELLSLAANCATLGVPLVDARSYGLVGQIRLFGGEHVVSDVKPDTPVEDLRMSAPFPELAAFVAKYDLASLNDRDFAHVPYPVLLISQLDAFKAAHGGALPKTTAEKDQFKAALKKLGRAPITEPNIDEALKNAYKAFAPARVPGDVQAVLANPKATEPAGQADDFWWVMAAVKRFVDAEGAGALPLQGGVPDMHSDTATFIALQTVFSAKSDADVAAVARHLQAVCAERSRATLPSEEYVRAMCKGAHYVALSSYRTLADQKTPDATAKAVVVGAIDDAANNISLYLLLRAVDQFHQAHGRFPGVFDDEVAGDIATLKSIVVSLLETYELPGSKIPDELVAEFVRFGATELHNVASIVGGVVAQEVLKLTTSKWTPFNNTFVFNSMNATSNTFAL